LKAGVAAGAAFMGIGSRSAHAAELEIAPANPVDIIIANINPISVRM
jgi:hypothetical protein